MSKLFSSKEIAYVLSLLGFTHISQKGSHGKFKNSAGKIVILPMPKKEIPEGTLRSILRQAGIDKDEFKKLLGN